MPGDPAELEKMLKNLSPAELDELMRQCSAGKLLGRTTHGKTFFPPHRALCPYSVGKTYFVRT